MGVVTLENGAQIIEFERDGGARQVVKSENFIAEWIAASQGDQSIESAEEMFVLFTGPGAVAGAQSATVSVPSVVIAEPGKYQVTPPREGVALVLATSRTDLNPQTAMNAGKPADARVAPVGQPFIRIRDKGPLQVFAFEDIPVPPDNKRIRFVQSATMSINLVLYDGPRGKNALSPHSHADIEQGTLALSGHYIHHLRTPWGPDGGAWRDDVHLPVGSDTLILIPPQVIHTSEGVEQGAHVLLDIFAPVRRDFRAKGWFFNADDYADPLAERRVS